MNDLLSKNLISTRDAAELSGYSADYLSRLVRSGEVEGTRVGRSWLIGRESLLTLLKEKGKNQRPLIGLVSTRVASKRSGYSPDYLARLVRSGEIDGTRVGRTWLITDASLTKFLAVQAERREMHARALAEIREKEYRAYQEPAPYARYVEAVPFVASSRVTTLRAFVVALLVAGTAVSAAKTLPSSGSAHLADFANEFSIATRNGGGTAMLLSAVGQTVVAQPAAVPSIARASLIDLLVATGERTALIVYHAVNRGAASTSRFLAGLFGPRPVIVIQPSSFQGGARVSTTTTTKTVTTIIRGGGSSYNTYVQGVTKDFVYQSLSALRFDILNTVQSTMSPVTRYSDTYISRTTVAATPSTSSIVLTTTGTGGPATFDGTTLNIPQYVGGSASFSTTSSAYWLSTYNKGFFFSTTSADHWGSTKGYLTSLSGAASSTLLADNNTWSGTNTFLNTPVLGSLTGLIFGNSGTLSSVATSTPTLASEFSYSGTLGALVGGASGTLSLATNGVALTKLAQVAANTILGNPTGALGNVQAFATSTLGIALTDTTGVLAIARGGTASSTPLGGILVGNGSSAIKSLAIGSGLLFDGSTLSTSGAGITSLGDQYHLGLTGGSQTFATSSDTNIGLTIVSSGSQHLFTPTWSGTLADARITSAVNWNTAYTNRITSATAPLSIASNVISMTQANGSTNGYLTSTDWTTFNAKQAALAFTYPLQNIANTISLAFGTTTSNTWGGTQTFTNAPRLGALSGVIYGNSGTLASVATTAPAAGAGISLSGTGAVVGGGLTITNTGVTSAQTLYGATQTGAIKFATSSTAINNDWDITNTGTTFLFNLPTATGLVRGLLSATKFTEFDAKQSALSFTYPLRNIANTISLAFGTTTANSWSGLQQFNGNASTTALTVSGSTWLTGLTGVTQCLRVDANGKVSGTGSDCGTGSGGVTGVAVYGTPQTGTITFATSTTAINNDWGITNSGSTFTFNLPTANSTTRGLLSSTDWTTFNTKFATTSSAYWLSTYNKGFFFSTTSADHWGATKGYLSAAVTAFGAQYSTLQTGASQTVASSTAGTDFKILSAGDTTTFYLPTASASARGLLSSADWTTFNAKQAALSFTYPLQNIANTISLAFGTTTSNTWGGTQTFTNAPRLGALSGVIYGNSGTLSSVATSSITAGTGVSFTGTPGALVGGTALTINNTGVTSLAATYPLVVSGATGAVTLSTALATTTVRQQYGTNQIGALVFATSTDTNIGLNITNSGGAFTYTPTWSGVLGIARGGTASSTALGGILVGNGLSAIKSLAIGSGLSFDGTTLSSTGTSFAWPFTARPYGVSTSTTVGFLNGLLSTASSTFSSAVRFSSLTPGGAAIGAGGILYSAATTTFSSGLTYANGNVTNTGLLSIRHASGSAQTGALVFATSTTAINNDWGITNSGSTFTFNLPTANSTTRGLLSSADWTTFNAKQAALSFTYPLQNIANTISLAFGTTTSNTWGGTQTFTNAPRLGALSGVIYGNSGTLSSVATSTPTLASEFSYSGTLGALVGGASGTLSLATNGVALTKLAQVAANTILGNPTGALGNVQAFATSSLGIALTDTTGTLGVGRGGTGQASFSAGQLLYGNGTNALSSVATSSVTAGTGVSFVGTPGALVGGTALTINTPWTINGNDIYKNNSGNVGIGSTTPGTLLSLGNTGANTINISNTATSTFGYGLNLKNGCYAVNGTCLTSGSGTNYWTNAGGNIYNNTGTNVGIGSTTPWATLSVNPASQAAGVPSFVVGSSTKTDFVITQSGKVIVGAAAPTTSSVVTGALLTISSGGVAGALQVDSTSPRVYYNESDAASDGKLWDTLVNGSMFSVRAVADNNLTAASALDITRSGVSIVSSVFPNGNVGIGTSTPKRSLAIASSTAAQLMLTDASLTSGAWNLRAKNSYLYFATSSPSTFATSSIAALTINPSGFVGVGVNAPAYKLDVGGYVNVSATTGYKQDGSTVLYTSAPKEGTYVGIGAGNAVPTGGDNSAFGYQALYSTTGVTGINNTAIGARSLYTNLGGGSNTALGFESLYLNLSGEDNTAVGMGALYTNSTGSYNTALGKYALNLGTGSSNVALGYQAGANLTTGTNNIIIGNSVDLPSIASSNMLSIGNLIYGTGLSAYNPTSSSAVSTGRIGIGTTTPWGKFSVNPVSQAVGEPSFVVGSSTKTDFIVTQAGNVGVGTAAPGLVSGANKYLTLRADVAAGAPKIAALEIGGTTGSPSTVSSRLSFLNSDNIVGSTAREIARIEGITASVAESASAQTIGGLQFLTADSTNNLSVKMVIRKTGAVGIGTTTPRGILTISTSTAPQITLTDASLTNNAWNLRAKNSYLYFATSSPSTFATSSVPALTISPNGYVGVGTAAPTTSFFVQGNSTLSGTTNFYTKNGTIDVGSGLATSAMTNSPTLTLTSSAGTVGVAAYQALAASPTVTWTGANNDNPFYRLFIDTGTLNLGVTTAGFSALNSFMGAPTVKLTAGITHNGTLIPFLSRPVAQVNDDTSVTFVHMFGFGSRPHVSRGSGATTGTVTVTNLDGYNAFSDIDDLAALGGGAIGAGATVTNLVGARVMNITKNAAATITNFTGVKVEDLTQGGTNIGIDSQVSSGSNKWNIYSSGTASNYFAGKVGIGTVTPAALLHVSAGADQGLTGNVRIANTNWVAAASTAGPSLSFRGCYSSGACLETTFAQIKGIHDTAAGDGNPGGMLYFTTNGFNTADTHSDGGLMTFDAAGLLTTSGGLKATAGGLTVTAGGATITAGGLTVTAGGAGINAGNLVVTSGTVSVGSFDAATDASRFVCADSTGGSILQAGSATSGDCDSSSRTKKHDIVDLAIDGIDALTRLRAVTYVYNNDETGATMWGFVAEELDALSPALAGHNEVGAPRSVQKNAVLALLTKALQEMNTRELTFASTTAMRLDSLEDRLVALESGAISVNSSMGTFSTSMLTTALADLGITVQRGIAQFNTLVSRQFVASRDTDGTSSAASVTINAGNTYVDITNAFVHTSTKILVTFSSQVQGSWWVSEKREGGFRVQLSAPQSGDVSFDYFLVQTDGQLMTPTTATSSPAYAVTQGGGTVETYSVQGTLPEVVPTPAASASTTPSTSGEGAAVVDSATTTTTGSSDAEVVPEEAAAGEDTVIITTTTTTTITTTVDAAPEPAPEPEQAPAADPAPAAEPSLAPAE